MGSVEGVNLVLQTLHGVIDVFLSPGRSKVMVLGGVGNPIFRQLEMLLVVELGIRRQDLVNAVSTTTPVLARRHVGNNLRHLGGGGLNGFRRIDFCIANLETELEHGLEINQAAVGHRLVGMVV